MIHVKNRQKKWHNRAHILPCLSYPSFCSRFKVSVSLCPWIWYVSDNCLLSAPEVFYGPSWCLFNMNMFSSFWSRSFLSVCGLFKVPIDFSFGQNAKAVRYKSDSISSRKCQVRITPVCIIVRRSRADCASGFNMWPLTRINTADFTHGLVSIIWIKKIIFHYWWPLQIRCERECAYFKCQSHNYRLTLCTDDAKVWSYDQSWQISKHVI